MAWLWHVAWARGCRYLTALMFFMFSLQATNVIQPPVPLTATAPSPRLACTPRNPVSFTHKVSRTPIRLVSRLRLCHVCIDARHAQTRHVPKLAMAREGGGTDACVRSLAHVWIRCCLSWSRHRRWTRHSSSSSAPRALPPLPLVPFNLAPSTLPHAPCLPLALRIPS